MASQIHGEEPADSLAELSLTEPEAMNCPKECFFLNLPSEIRCLIYQYLFNLDLWRIPRLSGCYNHAGGCCDLRLHDGKIFVKRRGWGPKAFVNFSAILRTCRLISKEALPILYDQTVFFIRVSDEQYARTMRLYAPLSQCAFLPHVQQIKISPDARTHKMLLDMPGVLEELTGVLTSPRERTIVEFVVSNGSLSSLPPIGTLPIGMLMEDPRWVCFLDRMSVLTRRVTFIMAFLGIRNNIQGRLDQLTRAIQIDQAAS